MKVTKKVTFVAKEEYINQLKSLLNTMIIPSRQEEGCLIYDIFQMEHDPKTFIVVESWSSEEALEGHKHSKHYLHYKSSYEKFTDDKFSDNLLVLGDE